MRFRNIVLGLGSVLTLMSLFYSDPNGGAMTVTMLQYLAIGFIAVGFAHLTRKALFDYLNMKELYEKAKESAVGSAIVFAGVCIVVFGLLGLFGNQARAETGLSTVIPVQAATHLPTLVSTKKQVWDDHPNQLT
jgi:hypothetical protein